MLIQIVVPERSATGYDQAEDPAHPPVFIQLQQRVRLAIYDGQLSTGTISNRKLQVVAHRDLLSRVWCMATRVHPPRGPFQKRFALFDAHRIEGPLLTGVWFGHKVSDA
jgi:hypothetical protein